MLRRLILTISLIIMILSFASVVCAITFPDIAGHWAESYITKLTEKRVISGYEDGTYRPNGTIKKGEFIKLMMCAAYPDKEWDTSDSTYYHWSGVYINAAERARVIPQGLINDDNANQEITRGEVVEILGKTDIIIKGTWQQSKNLEFYDIANMTNSQKAMLRHCVSVGYINGYEDFTFKPERTLTRAEVATIIFKYMEKQ